MSDEISNLINAVSSKGGKITSDVDVKTNLVFQDILDKQQNRGERKQYAKRTFVFLSIFTFLVLSIVLLQGFNTKTGFVLSEAVLITLITTSLASIVGIFLLVMQYLFKK